MRVIGYSLLLLLLTVLVCTAAHSGIQWLETTSFLTDPNGIRASRSTAYRVSSSDWLEFGLPEHGRVRILSNSAFKKLRRDTARYAIDYELLDSSGQIVLKGRYHHRARMTLLVNSNAQGDRGPISKTAYAESRNPGSDAEDFWIEAPAFSLPGRLRLRIAEQSPAIVEIAARAYQRVQLSPRKANSAWQRLGRRKREKLTRGFALSSEWLESFETTALASFSWRPLGPRGVELKDYEERALTIVTDPRFERKEAVSGSSATGSLREQEASQ